MRSRTEGRGEGFTLVEVVIVCVVIGILATIALPRFVRVIEKARTSEARNVLGVIRDAQSSYFLEYDVFTTNMGRLGVVVPAACNASYHFRYSLTGGGAAFTAHATRCTAGGKAPNSVIGAYVMRLTNAGVMTCTDNSMI